MPQEFHGTGGIMSFTSKSLFTRRRFLHGFGSAGVISGLPSKCLLAQCCESARLPVTASKTSSQVANNTSLTPGAFQFLPLGSIYPRGWLRNQLLIQANGLSGHLDETWDDVGPNSGWLGGNGESWERGPYYLDGLVPLAYLLQDARLKEKAQRFVEWTLSHQSPDGMIGPASSDDWWPRMVMLKALTQYQEYTGDDRVIPVIHKYFRHQLAALPSRPLKDWGRFRWQDELLTVLWLHRRSSEPYLLDLARLLKQQGHDWMAQSANFQYTKPTTRDFVKLNKQKGLRDLSLAVHGVNNAQGIKAGAVWSLISGEAADRQASIKMISELEKYHGLPNGMFSCDEHLAGMNPSQGAELCSVVEYMFSLEHCLAITGDPSIGDRLERLAFNALPGTFNDDMWAHQYNQEPNQVECSLHHKPWTTDGPESNLYGLAPNFGCCTANFHQGWPKFAASLFMSAGAENADGLAAMIYAPCEVLTVIKGIPVHIVEQTDYPFRGVVRLEVTPASPVKFPLHFRIPAWAANARILVNGKAMPAIEPGTFAHVDRNWQARDTVEINFPMRTRVSRWFNESIAVERGPLVFSYGIGENWVKLRDRRMTADWQVFPASQWNYALKVDADAPDSGISVLETPVTEVPFSRQHAPVTLAVKARRLNSWRAEDGAADPPPQSPVTTEEPEETISLIPYAAAKLRITAFPQCKS
jgi:hypothetical protein